MKLTRLLAAIGICALFAIPASAEPMEILFNDEVIAVDVIIENDRTAVTLESLEMLGINIAETSENGVVFENDGKNLFYDFRRGELVDENGTDLGYIEITAAESVDGYFPLRMIAEHLGIAVGWDPYENAVVLIDLPAYFEEFKEKSPELYEFLALEMKQPASGKGNSDISVNLEFPDFDGNKSTFKLKLIESNAALDNLATTSMTLEELLYSDSAYNYVLSDVTLDGIFDIDTMTIYFKTNAVKKIYDSLPEDSKGEMAAITQLFADEVWYKLSVEDYMSFIFETMLGAYEETAYAGQIIDLYTKMYEGITFGDIYSAMVINDYSINDIYAFEYVQQLFEIFKMVFDNGWMKVETTDRATKKLVFDVTVDSIVDYYVKTSEQFGYTPTQEEIEETRAEMTAMFGDRLLTGGVELIDGIPVDASLKMDINFDGGLFNMDINSKFDTNAEVGEIAVPTDTVDLIPLIETLMEVSGAV
ncbi:MAG: hypothetical protein KIG65_03735 [Eubacteriales bacterium]|nr:hypothetical protein [Eubacteriales bacterium]